MADIPSTQAINRLENIEFLISQDSVHKKGMLLLKEILENSSYYFTRFIHRIYQQYDCYACYIKKPSKFDLVIQDLRQQMLKTLSFDEKKELLGKYFDLKFLQVGIYTLSGMDVNEVNRLFTEFSTRYFQELFKLCSRYIQLKEGLLTRQFNQLALFASGGLGREKAFEDDFDLILIVDTTEEKKLHAYRQIVGLMNTEILKRGTLPHFRFSEYFGEYFCRIDQLKNLFKDHYKDIFVDKSQILESRLISGSIEIDRKFRDEIIKDLIFPNGKVYINQMINELHNRHQNKNISRESNCENIKECYGGLRDIEMIILIYKVFYKLIETNPYRLLSLLGNIENKLKKEWTQIRESLKFQQRFRYLHRIMVSAEDNIYPEHLTAVAQKMGYPFGDNTAAGKWLWDQFVLQRGTTGKAIKKLIQHLQ